MCVEQNGQHIYTEYLNFTMSCDQTTCLVHMYIIQCGRRLSHTSVS